MRVTLYTLALCLALGCNKDPSPDPAKPGQPKPTPESKAAPVAAERPDPLTGAEVLSLIPADALFVAAARDFPLLVDRLGRKQIIKEIEPLYNKAVGEVTQATGKNLLDPAVLPELGIDGAAPFGFVWFDAEDETFGFFAGLSDPEKFKTWLYDFGGRTKARFETETAGDALIIYPKRDAEVRFFLKGKHALLVISDESDDRAIALTKRLSTLQAADSMAQSKLLADSMKRLGFGRDLAAFVNTKAIGDAIVADVTRDRALHWAERDLKWARDSGDADRIARAEARVAEARKNSVKRIAERKAKELAAKAFLAPFQGAAFGVTVEDQAIRTKFDIGLTPESHYRKMIGVMKAHPRIYAAVDGPPLFVEGLKVELDAVLTFAKSIMVAAEGPNAPAQIDQILTGMIGRDLAGLFKMFDGEAGFAVQYIGDPQKAQANADPFDLFTGAVFAGVKDPAGVKAMFTRLQPMAGGDMTSSGEGRWTLKFNRDQYIELAVTDTALIVAPTKQVVDRMVAGKDDGFFKAIASSGADKLLAPTGAAATIYYDWPGQAQLMARQFRRFNDYEPPMRPGMDPKQVAEEKVRRERRKKALEAQRAAEDELLKEITTRFGPYVGQARGLDSGANFEGHQLMRQGTVGDAIAKIVAGAIKVEEAERSRWRHDVYKLEEKAAEPVPVPVEAAPE